MCKGRVAFPQFTLILGASIDYTFIIVTTSVLTFLKVSLNLTIRGHHRKKMEKVTYENISEEILRETYSKTSFSQKI